VARAVLVEVGFEPWRQPRRVLRAGCSERIAVRARIAGGAASASARAVLPWSIGMRFAYPAGIVAAQAAKLTHSPPNALARLAVAATSTMARRIAARMNPIDG
jgi:hypothetical protein